MFELKIRVYNTRQKLNKFVYVVDINGFLDANSFPEFAAKLDNLINESRFNIILNCKRLEFISSTCLGLLLKVVQSARENGGDLCLLSLSASIHKVIKILGFSRFFKIFDDEKKAVAYFDKKHK